MATEKKDPNKLSVIDEIRQEMVRWREESPLVKTRWYVVDYFPSVTYSDEYENGWTEPKSVRASGYLETEEDAIDWMNSHDPDPGAQLLIHSDNLRTFTENRWVNW